MKRSNIELLVCLSLLFQVSSHAGIKPFDDDCRRYIYIPSSAYEKKIVIVLRIV